MALWTQEGLESFFLQQGPYIDSLSRFDWHEDKIVPFFREKMIPEDIKVSSIYCDTKSKSVVLYDGALWDKRYFLVDFNDPEPLLKEITKLFSERPIYIEWDRKKPNNLFLVSRHHVNRVDIEQNSVYPRYFDNIKGFGLSDEGIYIMYLDNKVIKTTVKNETHKTLLEDEYFGQNLFLISSFYTIKEIGGKNLVFLGEKGDLIATKPPYHIEDGVFWGLSTMNRHIRFFIGLVDVLVLLVSRMKIARIFYLKIV